MTNSDDLQNVTTDINGNPTDKSTQDPHSLKQDAFGEDIDDESSYAGGHPGPRTDDDVGRMMAEVTGNEPPQGEQGTTIAEQMNMDEANRHGSEIGADGLEESLTAAPGRSAMAEELEMDREPGSGDTDSTPPDDKQ